MNVFALVFLIFAVLQTCAEQLKTKVLPELSSHTFRENTDMSFVFFATSRLRINLTLNKEPYVLCREIPGAKVVLRKLGDGFGQCLDGVTPYEYHEIKLTLQSNNFFRIEDPSAAAISPDFLGPVAVDILVGKVVDESLDNVTDKGGAAYVTRVLRGCPDPPGDPAVTWVLTGVVVVLALLLALAVVVSCILYLLVPPETIKRVFSRSGGNGPGSAAISPRIGQKEAQATPPPPPRPTNAQTPCQTRTPLAKVPSLPLAPPNATATPRQAHARRSDLDDGYDPLHDPNYDYIEANVVRPVDRAILDQELAGANPKWKPPAGGFRKKSDPQAVGFRKISDTPAPQPCEDDDYLSLGSGYPPPQQYGRGFDSRGYPAYY